MIDKDSKGVYHSITIERERRLNMGRLGEIQSSVQVNFAEQFVKGFHLGQDMLDAIPHELDTWKKKCGVHVVGGLVGYGAYTHTYRESDLSLYGFPSLHDAGFCLSLLKWAWRPYVDIIEVSTWKDDREVTLKVGHSFPAG